MKEFDWITKYFAPLAKNPSAFSLLDDVAQLDPPPDGQVLIITSDMIVEGVHYLPDTPPDDIARKLCAVNLSDLAAKGAIPTGGLLNFAPFENCAEAWVAKFARGLKEMMEIYNFNLLGGDMVAMPQGACFSLTLVGRVPRKQIPLRAHAKINDDVYVSGQIGAGVCGLADAKAGRQSPWATHYRRPKPRLALGQKLQPLCHAASDVSDGLLADLTHICTASGCGMEIQLAAIPLADSAPDRRDRQLVGGDDYELIWTADPADRAKIAQIAASLDVAVTHIGQVVQGDAVRLVTADGQTHTPTLRGWQHF